MWNVKKMRDNKRRQKNIKEGAEKVEKLSTRLMIVGCMKEIGEKGVNKQN